MTHRSENIAIGTHWENSDVGLWTDQTKGTKTLGQNGFRTHEATAQTDPGIQRLKATQVRGCLQS